MVIFLLAFFIAAALSLTLTPVVARVGVRAGVVDVPDGRKVHTAPTPRVGGVSIALAVAGTLTALFVLRPDSGDFVLPDPRLLVPFLVGAVMIFALGLCDDIRGLSALPKVIGEVCAAAIIIWSGVVIDRVTVFGTIYELGVWSLPATLLWIVGITNAFNLVDGVDGLAGGLTCIAASTCAAVLLVRGDYAEALLLVVFVGAVVGFLPYNFTPAEVFLGDSGSLLCGFLLAVTAIAGRQKGATALAVGVPLMIFALPILDTGLAIVRRIAGSQRGNGMTVRQRLEALSVVMAADRGHIHHRLIARGLSHRRAVLVLYTLALVLSVLALVSMERP
jgi:UDP-GlcNAc:undecaprenyl-phosphate GlcNAc-1-phosphate transferase